jgi:hypothetical protein
MVWRSLTPRGRSVQNAPASAKRVNRTASCGASCEIFAGFDEMIYSIADHGGKAGDYDGGVYIKEAESSALLKAYAATDPVSRKPRHFSFVGSDKCYEVLGFSEPIIRAFDSPDEAYAWGPSR